MTRRRAPWRLVLALALFCAGLVAIFGATSLYRKVQTFQPTGLEIEARGGRWVIVEVEGEESPLRPGDQVLLVNQEPAVSLDQVTAELRRHATSVMVVQRGEELTTLTHARPPLDPDGAYLILAVIGAIYLLIGLYTLLRDPGREGLLFYLWCLASAVVYLLTQTPPYDLLGRGIYVLEELARLFLPPLTLHFFLIFPSRVGERRWLRPVVPFLYLPAASLLVLQFDLIFNDGRWLAGEVSAAKLVFLDNLELYLLVFFSLAAVGVLAWHLLRADSWQYQRQVLWIAVGMVAGYVPFLLFYVIPNSLGLEGPEVWTVLSVLPLALVPLSFAYAILRYRLWDVAVIVRDAMTYSLTLLVGVFGFSVLQLLISRGIPEHFAGTRNFLTLAALLLVAGLLIPTKQGIGATLERVHYRSTFSKRRSLAEFGRELLHERDLAALSSGLVRQLEEAIGLDRINLYLADGSRLIPVTHEDDLPAELPLDDTIPGLWDRDFESISGVSVPSPDLLPVQRLFLAGYRYAFPLTVRGSRVGMVITSYKHGQIPLNSDDVELVRQLLNQAALAIENAQLLEQLHRQLQEVLELKQFNEKIIESSPAGIVVLDENDQVISANLAFAALVGMERSATRRRNLSELLPLESSPKPQDGLIEISYIDHQKKERHLQLSVASFLGSSSDELKVLVIHDVSERVAMERALKEKDRLAALGVMAAGVAHEVNTPLTGISSYAQLLLAETPSTDPRYALLKKVERQSFRAARIVNSLLDFARNRESAPRTVDIPHLLDECIGFFAERIEECVIRTVWEKPGETILVRGNEGELHQVFTNLLANAIDAMTEGGGTLTLRLETEDQRVRVCVEDTGPGIPPDRIDQIFQPFFSTKLRSGGTGLGLSISYEIVRRHGGDMAVANNLTEGCHFTVELPRLKQEPT